MLFQVERPAQKCTIIMAQIRGRGNSLPPREFGAILCRIVQESRRTLLPLGA